MRSNSIAVILPIVAVIIFTGTLSDAATINYTYDVMGRLTQADYGNGIAVQYTYDSMGNRTSQTAPPLPPGLPIVTTETPTVMTFGVPPTVYATFEGTVNANRGSTAVTFEYGLTTAYGSSVAATPSPVTGLTATKVTNDTVTGLALNTTYHYRVKAVNPAGTSYGNDVVFTTPSGVVSPVTATPAGGAFNGPVTVTLSGVDALYILYSTDGSPPSQFYSAPLTITATTALNFMAMTNSGISALMTEIYTISSNVQPVMIAGATPLYFATLQDACSAAGNGTTIKARGIVFTENLLLSTAGKTVIIKGGYDQAHTTQSGVTVIKGTLTTRNGRLVAERLVIR